MLHFPFLNIFSLKLSQSQTEHLPGLEALGEEEAAEFVVALLSNGDTFLAAGSTASGLVGFSGDATFALSASLVCTFEDDGELAVVLLSTDETVFASGAAASKAAESKAAVSGVFELSADCIAIIALSFVFTFAMLGLVDSESV